MSEKKNKIKEFNMIIAGTGGQGLITLLQIIAEAAFFEGNEVRTSELHGLAQRGGSVEVHIRFGQKIYSPLVSQEKADLILSLEMQESLKPVYFAGSKTKFLLNKYIVPLPLQKNFSENEILEIIKKISKPKSRKNYFLPRNDNVFLIPAAEICQKNLGTNVVAGVYLISLAVFKNLIPLKSESIFKAIKKIIPKKYLELNLKAFQLAKAAKDRKDG